MREAYARLFNERRSYGSTPSMGSPGSDDGAPAIALRRRRRGHILHRGAERRFNAFSAYMVCRIHARKNGLENLNFPPN